MRNLATNLEVYLTIATPSILIHITITTQHRPNRLRGRRREDYTLGMIAYHHNRGEPVMVLRYKSLSPVTAVGYLTDDKDTLFSG